MAHTWCGLSACNTGQVLVEVTGDVVVTHLTEEIDGGHLPTEKSVLVQLCRGPDVTLVEGFLRRHQPGHLGAARKLPVHKHLQQHSVKPLVVHLSKTILSVYLNLNEKH